MTQMSAIEHAEQMGVVQRVRPSYGYYRQPNGWITCSPVTDLEELNYRREGWEPLPQYGRVEMTSTYMADHPLEVLFMNGGAAELPVEQVIEQGLWMNPPKVPRCRTPISQLHKQHRPTCWSGDRKVEFPQVPGDTPRYHECHFCQVHKPTEKARDQHESVMHKPEQGDLRTGKALADALIQGFNGQQPIATAAPSTEPAAERALRLLTNTGLTKKQLEALRSAGLIARETEDAEAL